MAISIDQLIRGGAVTDQAELAPRHLGRELLTQIKNLLLLATDIQKELLFLPVAESQGSHSAYLQGGQDADRVSRFERE